MINTIIFDLGNVLIDWNPAYVYRTIFDTEEEVKNKLYERDIVLEFEKKIEYEH